jgi:hypothetical protein
VRAEARSAMGLVAAVAVVAAVALLLGACGGGVDGGDDASDAAPETARGATGDTTAPPADMREALTRRLTEELGDAEVAGLVVAGLGDETVAELEARVGVDGAATSDLLAYRPPTVPDAEVDQVVVFSFGNRVAEDGTVTSGPMNEALADATAVFVADHPVPVYAQWEVARLLADRGVAGVVSIDPDVDAAGEVVYLSTAGVAAKAVTLATDAGTPLGAVGVLCFQDHAARCVSTARSAGMDAAVPEGAELPSTYDPGSGQPWTRDRVAYVSQDLTARLLTS